MPNVEIMLGTGAATADDLLDYGAAKIVLATGAGGSATAWGRPVPIRSRGSMRACRLRDAGAVLRRQGDRRQRRRSSTATATSWPSASPRCWPTGQAGDARHAFRPRRALYRFHARGPEPAPHAAREGHRLPGGALGRERGGRRNSVALAPLRCLSRRLAAHRRRRDWASFRAAPAPISRTSLRHGRALHRPPLQRRALSRSRRRAGPIGPRRAPAASTAPATALRRATSRMPSSTAIAWAARSTPDPQRPRAIIRERRIWGGETWPKLGDPVL